MISKARDHGDHFNSVKARVEACVNESASFTAISLVVSLFSDGPFLTMILLLSFRSLRTCASLVISTTIKVERVGRRIFI